jgi:D-alanyl-D-alanine endopeptidase (penicillin-binding protein 7)
MTVAFFIASMTLLSPPEPIMARAALVVDAGTGDVLFEQGEAGRQSIASISKLMAVRVVLQRGLSLDASTELLASDVRLTAGGSRSRLVPGRQYLNRDLVHAALLGSDNRAVHALGRAVGLDAFGLVAAMNLEARVLEMHETLFVDPTGIEHRNVSTTREVTLLLRAVLTDPVMSVVTRTATWEAEARDRWGHPLRYRNTNLLVHDDDRDVLVGKTGFNSAAGWCVTSLLQLRNGRKIVVVVLGSSTKYMRFRDARRLESWAGAQEWQTPQASL